MEMVHFIPPGQRRLALLAAQADSAPVLISGASGTGKGAIARWIHANSPRAARPFIEATRHTNLVAQIFKAQGGTLLVSEIGEFPLSEQKNLLNFINTKSVPHPENPQLRTIVNVRMVVTSDQALEGRAQGGLFNPELLEKLNVFRLEMPPLSRRHDEFDDIVVGILNEITHEFHREHLRAFDAGAWVRLRSYDWPGSIRELRNVLRLAVLAAQGDEITEGDLPDFGHHRIDFRATREQFEKIYILELLRANDWDVERTCNQSQIDRLALQIKIQKYGITIPQVSIP